MKPLDKTRKWFMEKVEKDRKTGCWNWTGTLCRDGYGQFWFLGFKHKAHRISLRLFAQAPDTGMEVDHLCRNRRCVNPKHLEEITPTRNKQLVFERRA